MRFLKVSLKKNNSGFTIIELLIATSVFSIILLIATYAIIQISRTYIRGYISSETQNTNRAILDQVTQAVQLSTAGSVTIPTAGEGNGAAYTDGTQTGKIYWFCVNGERYTWVTGVELTSGVPSVFLQDAGPVGCTSPATLASPPAGSKELLSNKMQILPSTGTLISLNNNVPGAGLYDLQLNLLYGDPGAYLTSGTNQYCASISEGGAFCSVSSINTTVEERTTAL